MMLVPAKVRLTMKLLVRIKHIHYFKLHSPSSSPNAMRTLLKRLHFMFSCDDPLCAKEVPILVVASIPQ